jgi:SAM-dependent methyltransferase
VIVMEQASTGELHELAIDAWAGPATLEERQMLDGLRPAVLDVGCGPGRIAAALAEIGVPSLGIDVSPAALATASESGAIVLERSVFDPLPGEGRWSTLLLLDGNIGIGGDPERLLTRLGQLIADDGQALVEVQPPGSPLVRDVVRLCGAGIGAGGPDGAGPWFDWAWVGADDIAGLAAASGFGHCEVRRHGNRYVAHLGGPATDRR